ncbi:MAG: dihydroorotase [Pseudanabaenaceae cyanobacterium SKYGB_i_bin29]|nr:dihydroorotase [Pseudanabaenaceae cyanobacterium SKYG29]MDW8420370.1 dihydroorotase [Pseudanabaenaceae cyanobacterium SKYGB_i_bin29]
MVDSIAEVSGYYPQAMVLTDRSVLLANVLLQSETSSGSTSSGSTSSPGRDATVGLSLSKSSSGSTSSGSTSSPGRILVNPGNLPGGVVQREPNSLVVVPALVDLFSRSGEPGFEVRETLASLQKCAQGGGFGRVAVMPYQGITHVSAVDYFLSYVPHPFLLWGSLYHRENLCEYADLLEKVVGFAYPEPIGNLLLLRRALEYLAPYQKPVLLVPLQAQLAEGVVREGLHALKLGLGGTPDIAETIAVFSVLELVRLTRCPVHLLGVSCRGSIALLEQAKNEHLPITASVLWTHLIWHTGHLDSFSPHLRLLPPLPHPPDQEELIRAVKNGTIDAIAINHYPYTYEETMLPIEVAPSGTIGLQFAFPLLWQQLVTTKKLTPLELLQALRIKPCQILGITPPDGIFALVPDCSWQLNSKTSLSLAQNTILWGQEIKGYTTPLTTNS